MNKLAVFPQLGGSLKRLMESFFDVEGFENGNFNINQWRPNSDVEEYENKFVMKMDLPGVEKNSINIETKDDNITISGKREIERKDDGRYERYSGEFSRTWSSKGIDYEKIEAEYKDGVLTITLPKKKEIIEKQKVRKIEVK